METLRCLTVPGPVSSGQLLVENTCSEETRQHCHPPDQQQNIYLTPKPMCLGDSGLYRQQADADCVTDELDNQVITNGDDNKLSEDLEAETKEEPQPEKRRQIGDEFYREAEAESEGEARIVKLTTSIITVSSDSLEAIPTSVLATSNKTPTIVSTEAFLANSIESELNQKLQEQVLSDQESSSPSPRQETEQEHHAPPPALHTSSIYHQDLSGQTVGQGPQEPDPMVVSYNGSVGDYPIITSHIMTATTESVLDSVLVTGLVKNEPEDLTGQRHRHGSDITLDVGVTAKRLLVDGLDKTSMGLVTSADGDSHIILNTEDLPLAPGFTTTTTGYDPPSFYSSPNDQQSRIYDSSYREQELYPGEPGYRSQASYSLYSSSTGLSVDLPSPDSGIGPDQITPRGIVDSDTSFDYTQNILNDNTISRKPWHDYGARNSDTEKIQIPKLYSPYGFRYVLDAPTSSAVRREDDKVTYINKGQFYGVTLEYHPEPDQTLKSATVKSVIMLVFRDGKSQEEEIKAWQFWHQRQHSVKQRIIDVDTKNSLGLVGHIEELSHNALAVYWNPLESPAKVNLAVQCLSTDFSTQKGVKGLPLHIQIDTFDDPRSDVGQQPSHRGYSQVKIFCDKGAERKLRDEERRAQKRRMTPSGKRRLDEMYHESFEKSEFYAMSDLSKGPTLFTPPESDGVTPGKDARCSRDGVYHNLVHRHQSGTLIRIKGSASPTPGPASEAPQASSQLTDPERAAQLNTDFPGFYSPQRPAEQPRHLSNGDILPGLMSGATTIETKPEPPYNAEKTDPPVFSEAKRPRLVPPSSERIMLYVRQETEDVYTPLHLVPPTVHGLISAIENKYKINASNIRFLYRKNKDGIVAKIDDDMLRHYCNEDVFLMQVMVTEGPGGEESSVYDITMSEIQSGM